MPHGRLERAGNFGVEADTMIAPVAIDTHCVGNPARIVVGMVVAERVFRVPVQVLPVDERNGVLDIGIGTHGDKK